MRDLTKLIVSSIMWIAVSLISVMALVFGNNMNGADVPIAIIAPLVVALMGTFFIWVAPELGKADAEKYKSRRLEQLQSDEKPKRMSKMDMLMELMDEDERYAFKEALKRQMLNNLSDGELNYDAETLESFMDDRR